MTSRLTVAALLVAGVVAVPLRSQITSDCTSQGVAAFRIPPAFSAEQAVQAVGAGLDEAPPKSEMALPIFDLWGDANARCSTLFNSLKEQANQAEVKAGHSLLTSHEFANPPAIIFDGAPIPLEVKIRNCEGIVPNRLVRLRTYNGNPVGPTIRVKPNDLLKIKVVNHSPLTKGEGRLEDPEAPKDDHNHPNDFSTTNLHTHGLQVSPVEPADDVFAPIQAGGERIYEYALKDHHPGTCWYHPHRHGSTAIQLCNGMAGALIVDPKPGADSLDAALEKYGVREEKIFVFQEIRCSREARDPAARELPIMRPTREDVYGAKSTVRDKKKHEVAERFLINGKHLPIVRMKPDQVQRWRCIHAGIDRRLGLVIVKHGSEEDRKKQYPLCCTATDGMTLPECAIQTFGGALGDDPQAKQQELFSLLPGNRSDFLVQLPTGVYVLQAAHQDKEFNSRGQGHEVIPLAILFVERLENREVARSGSPGLPELIKELGKTLLLEARKQKPPNGAKNFKTIEFRQGGGRFEIRWKNNFGPANAPNWKWRPFSETSSELDLVVQAGTVEHWTLKSESGNHPFHIHVNPFFVRERRTTIRSSDGENESVVPDPIDQWHDTVLVGEGQSVDIYIRFERSLTGETVFHCHNLDHEDKGMMMRVRIEDPDKKVVKKAYGFKSLPEWAPNLKGEFADQHGEDRKLREFAFEKDGDHGDLLLVFVRSVSCEHCFEQLKAIESKLDTFRRHKLNVVAVCPDDQKTAAKACKKLSFPVLADPELELFDQHLCMENKTPLHGAYLIDRGGSVRWQHVENKPLMYFEGVLDLCRKGLPLGVISTNFKFVPDDLKVDVGQTVEWANMDGMPHSVLSKHGFDPKADPVDFSKLLFGVKSLTTGNRHSVLFTDEHYKRAGGKGGPVELDYFCHQHPDMKGKIKLLPRPAP
ncbi:MAG: multicopper oxidase domain-containing protein [Gemmataceae bacterium]|nr:multicopper oxidase domain-containing protein [Gemmataceae bacterium]